MKLDEIAKEIREDRSSGASQLTLKAARAFLKLLEERPSIRNVRRLARILAGTRPSMPSIANMAYRVNELIEDRVSEGEELSEAIEDSVRTAISEYQSALRMVVENAIDDLKEQQSLERMDVCNIDRARPSPLAFLFKRRCKDLVTQKVPVGLEPPHISLTPDLGNQYPAFGVKFHPVQIHPHPSEEIRLVFGGQEDEAFDGVQCRICCSNGIGARRCSRCALDVRAVCPAFAQTFHRT